MTVNKHGFDESSNGYSGINDWNDLPKPYSESEFIFQQIENTSSSRYRLFRLVKVPDGYDDFLNRVFSEMPMYRFAENIEETSDLGVEMVYLSGRYDDSYPDNVIMGGDYDINDSKIGDYDDIDVY